LCTEICNSQKVGTQDLVGAIAVAKKNFGNNAIFSAKKVVARDSLICSVTPTRLNASISILGRELLSLCGWRIPETNSVLCDWAYFGSHSGFV